jgi:SAM-dependent MidA family methyltransferase
VHQVVMRGDELREVYVTAAARGVDVARGFSRADDALTTIEGPLSTPALATYLSELGITLESGWRAEINLRAVEWVRSAARRLRRGFIIVIDYGHEARELYSVTHAGGTLTTFRAHTMRGAGAHGTPVWLRDPGERDITAHVDFTSIRAAAESEGLEAIAFLDQTYFLLGLLKARGLLDGSDREVRPLMTLVMPGGLGSTHKVMIFGKCVGTPTLRGCSSGVRVT